MSAENERTGDGGVDTREESRDGGAVATDSEHLVELYRKMVLIRTFEEATQRSFRQGKIGGYLHVYIGQEAVATGFLDAYREGDAVITAYRDHPFPLLLGSDPKKVMAELYGKGTGIVKGKGGSMHLFDVENGMYGGYGIVGGHVPIAAGAAFASKYRGDGAVTLCFFGEGASTIGGFAEGLALAALWKLPVVLICENNQYSMGTPVYRSLAVADVSLRALSHGMPRDRFDGDDVVKVKRRIAEAVERARTTGEPTLVEVVTYRFRGHSMSDPGLYRTKDEVEEWKRRDPLTHCRQRLLDIGFPEADLNALEDDVRAEIEDAVKFAEDSPPADEYKQYVIKE